jgi:DNA-binding PadR family transcriptional regulator
MFGKGHEYRGNRISPSQMIMLIMLRRGPMYGYELLKALRKEFEGAWTPKTGAIYPALKRLEEHGLIRSGQSDGRDYYSLTGDGREWLEERLGSMSAELVFMHRYFEVLSEAALEVRVPSQSPLPENLFMILQDAESDQEKLVALRKIRDMLKDDVERIEKGIQRLESRKEGQ